MLDPRITPRWGSDPEGFFQKDGRILGSERIIPPRGISTYSGRIVRDGVQFELNPASNASIPQLGRCIGGLFMTLSNRLEKYPGVQVCFDGLVEVSEEELASLSPATRVLGCMPSFNAYELRPINVDPVTYRKRSSGGHIHVGSSDPKFMAERNAVVPNFDIIVGNTCVLFDRDPGAAERRENYGRAGEFRLPDHGLEYRTTSNFWLRDYTLMELTFGLAHIAYALSVQALNGDQKLWTDLASKVNLKKVVQAIDTNDFDLALKNFKRIVPFLKRNLPQDGFVLTPKNLDAFIGFAEAVNKNGMDYYLPIDGAVRDWAAGKQNSFNDVFLSKA